MKVILSGKTYGALAASMAFGLGLAGCGGDASTAPTVTTTSADNAIASVSTIDFVDLDGPKTQAIVIKYNNTLKAGTVNLNTYDAYSYANLAQTYDDSAAATRNGLNGPYPAFANQTGTPGAPTYVYVSSTPTIDSTNHTGSASGNYVVIELNTNYLLANTVPSWRAGVAGGVKQKAAITVSENQVISPGTTIKGNYVSDYYYNFAPDGSNNSVYLDTVLDETTYTLKDLSGYKLYTDDLLASYTGTSPNGVKTTYPNATILSMVAGAPFQATNCFSEYDGKYHNVSLKYSLFVPADYDPSKKYMVVLHTPDAGGLGDDPLDSLTEAQEAANYASDRVQGLAKAQGYGGLIVVIPQIPNSGQDVADNLSGNEYIPAVWQLLDSIVSQYNIDSNRIYGSGQSMGGMQTLYMASMRDNYFAGIWAIASQWGNNYSKTFTYPTDGKIITNPEWQNWYYAISDDNVLATNMTGDPRATGYWNETQTILSKYTGVTIPYVTWDPTTTTQAQQNASLDALLATPNKLGIYWNALANGSHKLTWVYANNITDSYNWLLSQTKQTEDARGKLPLNGLYSTGQGTNGYSSVQY
ncbi:prolyl oligopeptidase family serine peptidase [Caballeronia sp. HLA56]